ncbi:hypothetical protein SDC9_131847 [bioreactor metagenome]|uniref:Uncharacterized protein n=1 Tax=bioreactor metagenome TaxID=1076179 RepID=A0A645D697_9ZZZZ
MQASRRGLHGLEKIAVVEAVHQVSNDLGVGLAGKYIALGLQLGTQGFVVLDDAVVHQGHACRRIGIGHGRDAGTMAEVGMGIAHRRLAVSGPAGMGNAGETFHMLGLDLLHQLGHAGCRARTLQTQAQAAGIRCLYSHTTGVITTILQPLQTLDQNRNNIAMRHRSNNATHRGTP